MSPAFVHLRIHSEFSISDGIVRLKPLAEAAVEMQMPALAVTDIDNLFGLIKFYTAATGVGVKPLVACDISVEEKGEVSPLVLIARNNTGYRNLSELISQAYLEGQGSGRPCVQKSWIKEKAEGLIALSAGPLGQVGKFIQAGSSDLAYSALQSWMEIFPDSFYLELHRTGKPNEEHYIFEAVNLALKLDCPVVATNDVRFMAVEEFEAHEVRVCIHDGHALDDPRRERRYTEQQYLKSPEQMCNLFSDIPEAIENTIEIAKRCNVDIDLGNYYLPEYPIPEEHTTETFFCEVSEQGLKKRLVHILDESAPDYETRLKSYEDRLAFELGVINKMGFPGYFLIVMEFIQWAHDEGIPVGPGRGSGAASLVAYVLYITDVDPIEYDLLFERFLNPERVSLPDFDIDFCMDGRDRVIQHVSERYGQNAVSQIITFGTMAAKAVVRDVARVQGKAYGLADKLSKHIPFDPGITLSKALEDEPLLREFIAQSEEADEIMEMAFKLEGITRNVGKHAGGVVIAPTKISDFSPVYCDAAGTTLITQFDKDDVESAGLVKFDFLGLRTLTIIDNAVKSINTRRAQLGEDAIKIVDVPLDDMAIYEDLVAAKTTAVFQLESRGMKELIKQVKPNRFGDIVALVALFRPGPLQLAPDFIRRKSGQDKVDYLHPSLKHVLEGTYGVMLYQEQVMQIAQVLAGYSLADADLLRRAMGKKKPEEMAKQRDSFVSGAIANDVEESQAGHIFDLMEKFAGYGFNKPHSVAYAWIAYQTAWLKHYYPADFMAAVLSADMQSTDKVVINVEECQEMKIDLGPPSINKGDFRFIADTHNSIIYGLGAVKGLGEGPIATIVAGRKSGGSFKDLYDLCDRSDARNLNKRALEALISCGALDELAVFKNQNDTQKTIDYRRALLIANQSDAVRVAEQKARNQDGGLMDLFGEDIHSGNNESTPYNYFKGLRVLSLKDRLNREKESLGLYLTGHPIDLYKDELKSLGRTRIVDLRVGKDEQVVVGLVVGMRTMKSKKGATIGFMTLDDQSGRLEVGVFGDLYELHHRKLRKDAVLFCKGVLSTDDFTGGVRMRVNDIYDFLVARERSAKRLKISMNADDLSENFTGELASILSPFTLERAQESKVATASVGGIGSASGSIPSKSISESSVSRSAGCLVAVDYLRQEAQVEITLGEVWRVTPDDDLIQTLRDRYGAESVSVDY
ncbi:MAG: DNA polymerase III subunit alpha [Pseudomonadales bacterium]|nr:DNA polymerase III subunit alpha [Pseudomonadales bacterium]